VNSVRDPERLRTGRQLPLPGEIFLDHVGHFVPDVEAARSALRRVGFLPTPPSVQVHPDPRGTYRLTGTGNSTAMLSQGYIEVLFKTADTPLASQLDAAMERYAGLHLVAFAVAHAADFHQQLLDRGFRTQPLINMQRPVAKNGDSAAAAFTLARVEPAEMPEGRVQALTHHTEQVVWQPRWLTHPNGALALMGVIIVVADIEEARRRYVRFTGREAHASDLGYTIELDRGRVRILAAQHFEGLLPEIAIPSLPFMGACEVVVRSLAALRDNIDEVGIKSSCREQTVAVAFPEELGQGAWLFTEGG
jgi:hypothetical protein